VRSFAASFDEKRDQLTMDGEVDYHVLSDMVAEASGKGVLRAIQRKYSATARGHIHADPP
jgi:hypothetical protein